MNQHKLHFPEFQIDCEVFLTLVDGYFHHLNITDNAAKYHILLCNLPQEVLGKIRHLVVNPPARQKYEAVCNAIRAIFLGSSTQRTQKLLTDVTYNGDVRQMWNEIERLVPDLPENFARDLFIAKLPSHLKIQAAIQTHLSILQLLELLQTVEDIHEDRDTQFPPRSAPPLQSQITDLRGDIHKLSVLVRDSATRKPPLKSPSYPNPTDKHPICYYHQQFQERARNCVPPCYFANQKN